VPAREHPGVVLCRNTFRHSAVPNAEVGNDGDCYTVAWSAARGRTVEQVLSEHRLGLMYEHLADDLHRPRHSTPLHPPYQLAPDHVRSGVGLPCKLSAMRLSRVV
jgi:hypothetical protein